MATGAGVALGGPLPRPVTEQANELTENIDVADGVCTAWAELRIYLPCSAGNRPPAATSRRAGFTACQLARFCTACLTRLQLFAGWKGLPGLCDASTTTAMKHVVDIVRPQRLCGCPLLIDALRSWISSPTP
jgi:hypothetical protein